MKKFNGEIILKEFTKRNLLLIDAIIANNVGYLSSINAPATDVSTVNEALNRPLTIMRSLHLTSMICVFDQAIYAKAFEVKCKEYEKFKLIILHLGTFHTLGTLISVIGKKFLHAGLKDLFIKVGVVAEGCSSGRPKL